LAKINTKTSGRIGGGIFTSKKENSISNIDNLSLSKEKLHQQQLCKNNLSLSYKHHKLVSER
tara:strand:+ start:298 stop:483 length:186 start_codon:yes stop_codon:yes gene_type:complete